MMSAEKVLHPQIISSPKHYEILTKIKFFKLLSFTGRIQPNDDVIQNLSECL